MSEPNTTYGTWTTRVDGMSANFETYVYDAFGSEGPDGFDLDAIEVEYRDAINDALPEGVSLCGSTFYGPYASRDWKTEGYLVTEDGGINFREIVETIDFWEIADKHRTDTDAE